MATLEEIRKAVQKITPSPKPTKAPKKTKAVRRADTTAIGMDGTGRPTAVRPSVKVADPGGDALMQSAERIVRALELKDLTAEALVKIVHQSEMLEVQ
jgi:hypothetical protein